LRFGPGGAVTRPFPEGQHTETCFHGRNLEAVTRYLPSAHMRLLFVVTSVFPRVYADSSSTRLRPRSLILSAIPCTSRSVRSLSLVSLAINSSVLSSIACRVTSPVDYWMGFHSLLEVVVYGDRMAGLAGHVAAETQDNEERDGDTEFAPADIMFVRMMIPHHEGAIQMVELIPARTDREELLDLRTEIIAEQEAEIDLMCDLLTDAGVAGCNEVGSMISQEVGGMMRGDGMHDTEMSSEMHDNDSMGPGMHPDEMGE